MKQPYVGYNDTFQIRTKEPGEYENKLGDALESAFKGGASDLEKIVTVIKKRAVPAPNGAAWSVELLAAELKRLGE